MNVKIVIASMFVVILCIVGVVYVVNRSVDPSYVAGEIKGPKEARKAVAQFPINPKSTINVNASSLPEFVYDIAGQKFQKILTASKGTLQELIKVKIVHEAHAVTELKAEVSTDANSKKLVVKPSEIANFRPGLYKMSIKMRTLEGEVDVEQDFAWGVIAVNTKKSVYRTNETVDIGLGVLNDSGQTQCAGGLNRVEDVMVEIISPLGNTKKLSLSARTIKDSGLCGETTVTNTPDFQAQYNDANKQGVYQMKVTAKLNGKTRSITDYFKVDDSVEFDIERTSFPTRIFPKSLYPATFTVTSKKDYEGEVSDIVPAFFDIRNISGGGILGREGDFSRIRWHVKLKANTPTTFTYFIKFPPISPEFYLIGPIRVGNFAEARQWQIASDAINSTSGVVTYEDNGASATWSQIWSGTAFLGQSNMDTTPEDSRWFVEKSSPKTGEKLVAAWDESGGTRNLFVFRWNGSSWTEDLLIANSAADSATRLMDVAYEEESGEALLVYGDSTSQLKYRFRAGTSGGSWTSEQNAGTSLDSRKRWVKAKARFNSDSILVGFINDNERIGALIWDGSTNTFENQFEDDDSPAQTETITSDEEAFDIAWETQSGTPMIFWGTAANTVLSREFSSGAWQSEATVYNTGFTGDVEWITASSDPVSTSDYIALAMQESDSDTTNEVSDCEFGVWDGSAGVTRPTAVSCRGDFVGRLVSAAFENTGSRAVWFYAPSESGTTGNTPAYRTWTNAGGFTGSSAITGDLTGNIESVQLHADLNTTSMIALTADSAGDLNYYAWDGSTWTANLTDLHSNIQNTGENAEAYGFGFDRNLETQVAYRWFANSIDLGASMTSLTAQDTPYTLTSANQAFRLRLLLYYPDSLLSSAVRQYKLQYVDPGSGSCASPTGGTPSTWTDVPTSGGNTISFNNNLTLNDGDNIATNAADPSYQSYTTQYQDYEEYNNFTNSRTNMVGDQTAIWDFSLIDNTNYDRVAQTYCFRVARSNDLVLRIGIYPQINTAAVDDVLIQGGTQIDGSTSINNP